LSARTAPVHWFPGHMAKASADLAARVKDADGVVELRDARIPFSSTTPLLRELIGPRARVIVMNKADLADAAAEKVRAPRQGVGRGWRRSEEAGGVQRVAEEVKRREGCSEVVYVNSKRDRSLQGVWSALRSTAESLEKAGRTFRVTGAVFYVVGVPNVGKSSFINSLRRVAAGTSHGFLKRGAKTGGVPGITRHVSVFKISEQPTVHVFDSPGVLAPKLDSADVALRLALCGCIPDAAVDMEQVAEFLLHFLRQRSIPLESCLPRVRKEGTGTGCVDG
jgi:ribosome biogenesis GTPase A